MLVIRLSPHRDARPRRISKPVCACMYMCVCACVRVLLLYQCGYIYNWNEAQHVIWLLPLLPIVFWVAALGPSWGLQHDAAVGICGVYVFFIFFAFLFCRRASTRPISRLSCDQCIDYYLRSIDPPTKIVCLALNTWIDYVCIITKVKDIKDWIIAKIQILYIHKIIL